MRRALDDLSAAPPPEPLCGGRLRRRVGRIPVSLQQVGAAMASIDQATALLSPGDGLMPLLERLQESYQVGGPLRDDGESNLSRQSWPWPV